MKHKLNNLIIIVDHNHLQGLGNTESVLDMKSLVDDVLDQIRFREKRARTMDIDDFMKLLVAFNEKGVHFV